MSYAILTEGLVKRYGKRIALHGLDLAVRTGSVLGLLGPNGAGKTTAVRILSTLVLPDAGRATVAGFDVITQSHAVRREIGVTGQYAAVDNSLNGMENLVLVGRLLGLSRQRARQRATELLGAFGLEAVADRAVKTYSGGTRRRLDLAASVVGSPRVIYLDEPTTGLDPRSRDELWSVIRQMVDNGSTVLLTTQYLEEADRFADDVAVVNHGRAIAQGPLAELKDKIGGRTFTLRPADPADVPAVAALIVRIVERPPQVKGGEVAMTADDPRLAPLVLRHLDEAGILIAEMSLRAATLDEVFLSLTSEPADAQRSHPSASFPCRSP
ncbi:ATP-binding cassette domain-containing protein [Micromonospora zamorensis]|uniref:ATP-binding cassette domain-containing protein n=1 Tax=Micromonospora zamorensis TaxID=709883 RepID=UPI003D96E0AD